MGGKQKQPYRAAEEGRMQEPGPPQEPLEQKHAKREKRRNEHLAVVTGVGER